ncbi:hypothetical protein DICPUDRAFT_96577 [Dictyostelium purpureum]|uniref:Right handed beta helix domain-containing protein n=1 Tax=Dictyostelium purpureum TaxID=5786 RepID=F0Z9K9_DICPU|nr:uncharacterized protein DICPUDRAFT_96577 [Dictyostelium purpureum]EGC39429.1 hypothetical protein DICPUDRAFT_96577 [Dictyostelium purpureum]|eukprot:XP_003284103.1 hypothetical protein DICPUDRAFT_96577 [Dictyostelium purpureum]
MIYKIIFIILSIVLINSNIIICNCENKIETIISNSCVSYIDINSNFNQTEECGSSLETPCTNITSALKTCNLVSFDEITLNFQPGQYNFSNIDVFGETITPGKSINIINLQYNTSTLNDTTLTTVIFDLSNSLNSFINISSQQANSSNSVYIYGITFQNGYQNAQQLGTGGSVLVSYGAGASNFTFENCIFQNNTVNPNGSSGVSSGGSIALQNYDGNETNLPMSLNITGCTYQNTVSFQTQGGFIFIADELFVNLVIDGTTFTNFSGDSGVVFYTTSVGLYNAGCTFQFSNSFITQGSFSNSIFHFDIPSTIQNVTAFDNTAGNIFSISANGVNNISFENCSFLNNTNTTAILLKNCPQNVEINDCIFENNNYTNSLDRNGAITIVTSVASIIDSVFKNNNSPYGSSIFINEVYLGNSINILNSLFESNNATYGGGLYTNEGVVNLQGNNTFINNMGVAGSAIYCQSSTISFQGDAAFENNVDTSIQSQFGIGCGSGLACTLEGNPQYQDTCSSYQPNKAKILTPVQVTFIVIGTILGAFLICAVIIIIVRKVSVYNRYRPVGY